MNVTDSSPKDGIRMRRPGVEDLDALLAIIKAGQDSWGTFAPKGW